MENKKTTKELYKIIEEIDISANEKDVEYHKKLWEKRFDNNGKYRDAFMASSLRLWMQKPSNKNSEGELFSEYIKKHPNILSTGIYSRELKGKKWIERIRQSNPKESKLIRQASKIYGGVNAEIMNTVLLYKNGWYEKFLATSGMMDRVTQEDIDKSLPKKYELFSKREDLELIVISHNHPNILEDYLIDNNQYDNLRKLIISGGLSRNDILLADSVYERIIKRKVPVIMMAISENGLTYTYTAGTSKDI